MPMTNDHSDIALNQTKSCSGGSCGCRCKADPVALVVATLMALVLGFAVYAKFVAPDPKLLALEYGVGAAQAVILVGMLAMHRAWWTWSGLTLMWAGLAGYSLFKSWHGESCGCFSTLWEPPPYSTAILNAAFAATSLGLSVRRGSSGGLAIGVLALALVCGAIGWAAGEQTTPPRRAETAEKHEGKDAKTRLFESELMADIREQPEGGPGWLVFCFDPTCHICEEIKPFMEFKQAGYAETDDQIMQIRMYSIPEVEKQIGIETYAWETPTIFIVRNGKITRSWSGKALEGWTDKEIDETYNKIADGEYDEPEPEPAPDAPK